MKKAVKINVKGTVQGVFFRNFIKTNADKLKIKGFVRNLENKSVESFAEGEIDSVDKLVKICETGPPHAAIKGVKIEEARFQDFKDFKVLHI